MEDGLDLYSRNLINGLPRTSPLRPIASAILSDKTPPEDTVETLCTFLMRPATPRRSKELATAAWLLSRMGLSPTERRSAASTLGAVLENRPGRNVGCFLASGCLTYLGFLWIAYASYIDGAANRVRAAAASALGRIGGQESVEFLARAMANMPAKAASGDKTVRIAAMQALSALLPSMPETGYGLLSSSANAGLERMALEKDKSIAAGALECLTLAGSPTAIPTVEHIIAKHKDMFLRERAECALAALQKRREFESGTQRLLRPTDSPDAESGLLRPASGSDRPPPDALLRPSRVEDNIGESEDPNASAISLEAPESLENRPQS